MHSVNPVPDLQKYFLLELFIGNRILNHNFHFTDDTSISEAHSSPMLVSRNNSSKSATPSPVAPSSRRGTGSISSQEWQSNEDDIERLVVIHHQTRSSLSSLGVSILFSCQLAKLRLCSENYKCFF